MSHTIDLNKVYPWVKQIDPAQPAGPVTLLANDGITAVMDLPWHPWLGDLGIFYVEDRGDRFELLQTALLPEGMDEPALYALACENLTRDVEFRAQDTPWGGAAILCGGNFEAASICLPHIADFIVRHYGCDCLMAVPARDLALFVPCDDEARIHNLKVTAKQVMSGGEHLLSKQLFRYHGEDGAFTLEGDVF